MSNPTTISELGHERLPDNVEIEAVVHGSGTQGSPSRFTEPEDGQRDTGPDEETLQAPEPCLESPRHS